MNFDMINHTNSGLLRFRSAPSSVLSNFTNGTDKVSDSNEGLNSRLISSSVGGGHISNFLSQSFQDLPPHYPRQSSNSANMDSSSYQVHTQQTTMGSNLLRQNSSPAGLFSHIIPQNGYAAMRGVGNVSNGDLSPSSSRLKGQMNFSSNLTSSLGMLSRISEIETETVEPSGPNASHYPFGSWDNDSTHFSETFTGLKRELDDDGKLFAGAQNGETINHPPMLSHHLSLPKTSGEMAAVEKLLHFQDSVPCKIRAKRGCATHPRSIAERVRRTRISERMRKLQELVPNMDKQTNTADKLDLAVDYIKDLQKQYKMLSDNRANCRCSGMPKPGPD